MQDPHLSPKGLRRARRFNLFLIVGLAIVVSALGLGAWEAYAVQTLQNLGPGGMGTPEYEQAQQIEDLLRIITPTWNFLGLGFLTLGIGLSIVVILFNLRGAGREAMAAFQRTFAEAQVPVPPQPAYSRAFPKLLWVGLLLLLLNFLFALWGGLTAAGYLTFSFLGFTPESWAAFTEVLRTPQRPGFLSFIVLGIGFSLATIVYNLRYQARALPEIVGALHAGTPGEAREALRPRLPRLPFALLVVGFLITLSASYPVGLFAALARADLVVQVPANPATAQLFALTQALFPILAVTGIVTMLGGIVYWLLLIIQALRDQRLIILHLGTNLAGARAVPLEQPLWPERVAGYLAGAGLLILLMLFVPAVLLIWIRWEVLALLPLEGGSGLATLIFLRDFLGVLNPSMRFLGMALVMLGIGLTLGVIVSNLRGMGMIMPGTMNKILQAKGKVTAPAPATLDAGDVEARAASAMSRFQRKLFVPLLLGALILISTTFPLVIPLHLTLALGKRDADLAGDPTTAESLAADMKILAALREPWTFIGMGLVFFAIGRYFGTIIGFVQARRIVISDTCNSLAGMGRPGGS